MKKRCVVFDLCGTFVSITVNRCKLPTFTQCRSTRKGRKWLTVTWEYQEKQAWPIEKARHMRVIILLNNSSREEKKLRKEEQGPIILGLANMNRKKNFHFQLNVGKKFFRCFFFFPTVDYSCLVPLCIINRLLKWEMSKKLDFLTSCWIF